MNRVIESDLLLDGSSVLRLQNLVTLIFKKKNRNSCDRDAYTISWRLC